MEPLTNPVFYIVGQFNDSPDFRDKYYVFKGAKATLPTGLMLGTGDTGKQAALTYDEFCRLLAQNMRKDDWWMKMGETQGAQTCFSPAGQDPGFGLLKTIREDLRIVFTFIKESGERQNDLARWLNGNHQTEIGFACDSAAWPPGFPALFMKGIFDGFWFGGEIPKSAVAELNLHNSNNPNWKNNEIAGRKLLLKTSEYAKGTAEGESWRQAHAAYNRLRTILMQKNLLRIISLLPLRHLLRKAREVLHGLGQKGTTIAGFRNDGDFGNWENLLVFSWIGHKPINAINHALDAKTVEAVHAGMGGDYYTRLCAKPIPREDPQIIEATLAKIRQALRLVFGKGTGITDEERQVVTAAFGSKLESVLAQGDEFGNLWRQEGNLQKWADQYADEVTDGYFRPAFGDISFQFEVLAADYAFGVANHYRKTLQNEAQIGAALGKKGAIFNREKVRPKVDGAKGKLEEADRLALSLEGAVEAIGVLLPALSHNSIPGKSEEAQFAAELFALGVRELAKENQETFSPSAYIFRAESGNAKTTVLQGDYLKTVMQKGLEVYLKREAVLMARSATAVPADSSQTATSAGDASPTLEEQTQEAQNDAGTVENEAIKADYTTKPQVSASVAVTEGSANSNSMLRPRADGIISGVKTGIRKLLEDYRKAEALRQLADTAQMTHEPTPEAIFTDKEDSVGIRVEKYREVFLTATQSAWPENVDKPHEHHCSSLQEFLVLHSTLIANAEDKASKSHWQHLKLLIDIVGTAGQADASVNLDQFCKDRSLTDYFDECGDWKKFESFITALHSNERDTMQGMRGLVSELHGLKRLFEAPRSQDSTIVVFNGSATRFIARNDELNLARMARCQHLLPTVPAKRLIPHLIYYSQLAFKDEGGYNSKLKWEFIQGQLLTHQLKKAAARMAFPPILMDVGAWSGPETIDSIAPWCDEIPKEPDLAALNNAILNLPIHFAGPSPFLRNPTDNDLFFTTLPTGYLVMASILGETKELKIEFFNNDPNKLSKMVDFSQAPRQMLTSEFIKDSLWKVVGVDYGNSPKILPNLLLTIRLHELIVSRLSTLTSDKSVTRAELLAGIAAVGSKTYKPRTQEGEFGAVFDIAGKLVLYDQRGNCDPSSSPPEEADSWIAATATRWNS